MQLVEFEAAKMGFGVTRVKVLRPKRPKTRQTVVSL
jgi:hypothetical protein